MQVKEDLFIPLHEYRRVPQRAETRRGHNVNHLSMKRLFLCLLLGHCFLFSFVKVESQTIMTIAGGGSGGGTDGWGTGLPATDALLGNFCGIVSDVSGNLFIADKDHNIIRKVDAGTGIITVVAGNGTMGFSGDGGLAISAEINSPGWLVFNNNGDLFFSDRGNLRIRKIDTNGVITTIAGNGSSGFSGDGGNATLAAIGPQGICFDHSGNLFIADNSNRRVRKINPSGIISTVAGNGIAGDSGDGTIATLAEFMGIYGIRADASGNLYVADYNDDRVRKINSSTNIITTVAGNGTPIFSADGDSAILSSINPFDVAIDDSGNLFIADLENNRIREVNTSGIISTIVGNGVGDFSGDGGFANSATLNEPAGVNFDQCGNLLIADNQNYRVRKVNFPAIPLILTNHISNAMNDTVCAGTAASYIAIVIADGGSGSLFKHYQWYVNGDLVSMADSAYAYTPTDGDSISCLCIINSLCRGSDTVHSNTIHMVVVPITTPAISIAASTSAAGAGSTVALTADVAGAGSSYSIQWYRNGVLFTTTATPDVTYTKSAVTDTITAVVIPAGPCADSAISAPQYITVAYDGVATLQAGEVGIYPNPAHTAVTVTGNITGITLTNTMGQVILTQQAVSGTTSIDVSSLPLGLYLLTVATTNGGQTVHKIVKE